MPTLEEYLSNRSTYADETKITLADGVETTLGQLRGGYMKEADYRQKTMDLSTRRKAFDNERNEWEMARLEAEGRLTELAKTLMSANPGMTRQEADEQIEDDPRAKKLLDKVTKLEARLEQYDRALPGIEQRMKATEEAYVASQHRKVLDEIRRVDPEVDVEELVNYAKSHYIGRLDDAYRSFRHEALVEKAVKRATEDARKEAYEKAKQDLLQPMITPRRTLVPGPDAPKDLDGARDAALQDPEILKLMAEGAGF